MPERALGRMVVVLDPERAAGGPCQERPAYCGVGGMTAWTSASSASRSSMVNMAKSDSERATGLARRIARSGAGRTTLTQLASSSWTIASCTGSSPSTVVV